MSPYDRIAILQRLAFDREDAEREIPCSAWGNCRGIRDPHHAACPACPLGATELRESWQERFLFHLAHLRRVNEAMQAAGANPRTAYKERRDNPDFAARWEAALTQ